MDPLEGPTTYSVGSLYNQRTMGGESVEILAPHSELRPSSSYRSGTITGLRKVILDGIAISGIPETRKWRRFLGFDRYSLLS